MGASVEILLWVGDSVLWTERNVLGRDQTGRSILLGSAERANIVNSTVLVWKHIAAADICISSLCVILAWRGRCLLSNLCELAAMYI